MKPFPSASDGASSGFSIDRTFTLQIVLLVGMWGIFIGAAVNAHQQARDQGVSNLTQLAAAVALDLSHNVDLLDLSLKDAANAWSNDEIRALKPSLRQQVLFDAALKLPQFGPLVLLDPYGSVMAASNPKISLASYAGREDFKVHLGEKAADLYIGAPVADGSDDQPSIPFSRRLTAPDGEFAGVATGALRLSYIQEVYRRMSLGTGGVLALATDDGRLVARLPELAGDLKTSPPRLVAGRVGPTVTAGWFEAVSQVTGVENLYGYHRIGTTPFVQLVGTPTSVIYADWRQRGLLLGALLALLSVGIFALQSMLRGEFRSRIAAETRFAKLATTDALTALANRRAFDAALEAEWRSVPHADREIGLLMVDVDHFKAYNDRFGHIDGDEVLGRVARSIAVVAGRHQGLACRYGGEEFAVLLPATDRWSVSEIGEAVLYEIRGVAIPHADAPSGIVTVSVGAASLLRASAASPQVLVEKADRQLYLAKKAGRDRLFVAPPDGGAMTLPPLLAAAAA